MAFRLLGAGLFLIGLTGKQPLVVSIGLMIIFAASVPGGFARLGARRAKAPSPSGVEEHTDDTPFSDWLKSRLHKLPSPVDRSKARRPNTRRPQLSAPAEPNAAPPGANPDDPIIRLRPVVPAQSGTPIHSWIGGVPHMPDDIAWPMADGKPALFLAQISCSHLPPRLWGARGPRSGWLLAFTSQTAPGTPILRYTKSFGPERQPPGPVSPGPVSPGPISPSPSSTAAMRPMRDDILARATGQPADTPRWPLEVLIERPGASPDPDSAARLSGPVRPVRPVHPGTARHDARAARLPGETDLSDPRFQPFDWNSLLILVETLQSELDWDYRSVCGLIDPDAPDRATQHYLDELGPARDGLSELRGELHAARAEGLPFTQDLLNLTLRGLKALRFSTFDAEIGAALPTPLMQDPHMLATWFRWFDHYARRVYCETPDLLPAQQRRMFERYWTWLATRESGSMGLPAPGQQGDALTLLRLPESDLMGWSFGLGGEFRATLPARALASGALNIGGDTFALASAASA